MYKDQVKLGQTKDSYWTAFGHFNGLLRPMFIEVGQMDSNFEEKLGIINYQENSWDHLSVLSISEEAGMQTKTNQQGLRFHSEAETVRIFRECFESGDWWFFVPTDQLGKSELIKIEQHFYTPGTKRNDDFEAMLRI